MSTNTSANLAEQEAQNPEIVEGSEQPVASEKTEALPPEEIPPSAEEPTNPFLAQIASQITQNQERSIDIRDLCLSADKIFDNFSEQSPGQIAAVLQKWQDVFDLQPPVEAEMLAKELITLENNLIGPFKRQVAEAQIDQGKGAHIVEALRESLYGVVLKGLVSADSLCHLVREIRFQKSPDDKAQSGVFAAKSFLGFFQIDAQGHSTISLYEGILDKYSDKIGTANQTYLINHELSHALVEQTNLWDEATYNEYLDCAETLDLSKIATLNQKAPELAQTLLILQNPKLYGQISNNYIQKRLEILQTLPESKQPSERRILAKELSAEAVNAYLSGNKTAESYLISRLQCNSSNDLINFLKSASSCETAEDFQRFCAERGASIDLNGMPPDKILGTLSRVPELRGLFGVSLSMFKKLSERFADRGQHLTMREPKEVIRIVDEFDFDEEEYGFYDDEAFGLSDFYQSSSTPEAPASKQQDPISSFWDFLTGKKSKPATPPIQSQKGK